MALKSNRAAVSKKLRETVDQRLEKSAIIIRNAVVMVTPVDTGRLRSSLTWLREGRTVYIGTNVYYAKFVHNGTRFQSAQPFLVHGTNTVRPAITAIWKAPIDE